jgi:hypothetical protein
VTDSEYRNRLLDEPQDVPEVSHDRKFIAIVAAAVVVAIVLATILSIL